MKYGWLFSVLAVCACVATVEPVWACSGNSLAEGNCCDNVGMTRINAEKTEILACVYEASGSSTAVWRSMTSTTSNVGRLHSSGSWRNAIFWCDSGYSLTAFHYDCQCTNNATWYVCQK